MGHHQAQGSGDLAYFYLYVILDVFSRYAVGWTVQHRENYLLAKDLIAQVCEQQHIKPKQLTVHADRGSLMTPDAVHHGRADAIHADRARVLAGAYAATPERFAQRPPRLPALPTAAWIYKPDDERAAAD